jgi:hypothetical protein
MWWTKPVAVTEPLRIVSIHFAPGLTERTYPAVRALVEACHADFADHLPPHDWLACFEPGHEPRADTLLNAARELRKRHAHFAGLGVGSSTGVVVFERDRRGRIRSMPLGDHMNVAMRAARADAASPAPDRGTPIIPPRQED